MDFATTVRKRKTQGVRPKSSKGIRPKGIRPKLKSIGIRPKKQE